jgi:hypothetical protein
MFMASSPKRNTFLPFLVATIKGAFHIIMLVFGCFDEINVGLLKKKDTVVGFVIVAAKLGILNKGC